MYLTKIEIDLANNSGYRAALWDSQKMHKLVSGFFDAQRKDAGILFCKSITGMVMSLYMYSQIPVLSDRLLPGMNLAAQRDLSSWIDNLKAGQKFGFRLLTMPFKKVGAEGVKNSRRKALDTAEERLSWLGRKSQQGGFMILSVNEISDEKINVRHPSEKGGSMIMNTWQYTGFLQITDTELFRKTLCCGIGPGKAYGLGMLVLSRG
ncbi:MAG: type I-E CRISPR-associated protein Cas6/Cse3/CasE [Succinimonas sp.]|nr:type I-E CRISPR-associated protein Cas6/Cse3/CasE [Succinimonas sp.]